MAMALWQWIAERDSNGGESIRDMSPWLEHV